MPTLMTIDRQRRRLHRNRQPLDHVGAVTGGGALRDRPHRPVFGRCVILGDPDDQPGHQQADQGADEQLEAVDRSARRQSQRGEQAGSEDDDEQDADNRRTAGDHQAAVQRLHDPVVRTELDVVGAEDRGQDADRADAKRQHQQFVTHDAGEQDCRQQHGGHDGHRISLEQVGCHAGAVADVVAHVVRDHGRVAGVILRNTRFDLAHQIGAHVGALGEDAAAETGEDGDQRSAEAKRDHRFQHRTHIGIRPDALAQVEVIAGNAQQAQADDQQPGDGARLEGDVETGGQAAAGCLRGAHIGAHRDIHADDSRSRPNSTAPMKKPMAVWRPRNSSRMTMMTTPTRPIVRYCRFR